MGSTNKDESVGVVSKNEAYEEILFKLECPFTWNMDDISKSINTDYNPHDEEEPIPLLKLLRAVMAVYVEMKDDENNADVILKNLEICDDHYSDLKNKVDPEISTNVVYAVLQATKCFVYFKLKMVKELELTLKNLENMDNMSEKEESTLLGCKSICWSKYHRVGSREAEKFIREAIKLNANCAIWHFILGKNIRRQRRDLSIQSHPSAEETSSFLKAYEMSKTPIYGIFVAQMYRERNEHDKALQMYNVLYACIDSLSNTVLLRLALGFMNGIYKDLNKAKVCLDKAEKRCAEHSMYLHYRGIYYMKKRNFEEAARFFKKAIEDLNFPAEKQYVACMLKSQKSFDVTKYLISMLDRYKSFPDTQLQSVILDLALSYWKRENDLKEAIKYFLRAIEIDPEAKCLTNCYSDVFRIKEKNVYVFLEKYIFPVIERQRHRFDEATIVRVEAIKEFCKMNTLGNAFTGMKIKK